MATSLPALTSLSASTARSAKGRKQIFGCLRFAKHNNNSWKLLRVRAKDVTKHG